MLKQFAVYSILGLSIFSCSDDTNELNSENQNTIEENFEEDSAEELTLYSSSYNLDLDGDGFIRMDVEGEILIRFLADFTGEALFKDKGFTEQQIALATTKLQKIKNIGWFDIDGDRNLSSQSDGIVIVRYIGGWRGYKLIKDVVNPKGRYSRPWYVERRIRRLMIHN